MTRTQRAILAVALLIAALPRPASTSPMLATIEAEFIERFTRFIEWPSGSAVGDPARPFVIGVLGDSPVEAALGTLAARMRIKGKPVEVRGLADVGEAEACQIVFVAGSHRDQASALTARLAGRPILTVGDSPGLAKHGVMINFSQDGEFVRFELNPRAAAASKLRMAEELLALGVVVK